MKKTLLVLSLMGAASAAMGESLHGVDFTSSYGEITANETSNILVKEGSVGWINGTTTIGGLWVENGAGFKMNASGVLYVTYLALGDDIQFSDTADAVMGQVNGSAKSGFNISIKSGGWVDINADYANRIWLGPMDRGTVYLNEKGCVSVTGTLDSNVLVDATLTAAPNNGYEIQTRTLIRGNFTEWTGTVRCDGFTQLTEGELTADASCAGMYTVSGTADGLIVNYVTPEPTTATLSLLALAGLCARRRRK